MNRAELKNILQSHYNRDLWIKTLHFLSGNRNLLTIQLSPTQKEFDTAEANRLIKTFSQIGTLKTSDGVVLPIFEIILEDGIRIEYNRVGVNEFIKKFILKDAIKGALTTFAYDENNDRNEWRFSFISKNSASDFFAEAESIETNPKKYTYIFGTDEEHRTAIERLYNLEQSRFRLEDFFEAFNVEPVSKKFFDEYKNLYKTFSDYISGEDQFKEIFLAEITDINNKSEKDITNEVDKNIRNFVSRLLGRMVFLYFLQKKHWLGASNTEYKDGSNTFLSDLFFNDKESQNDYYEKYLSPIFFNALNTPDRKNEEFKLHNGKTVCIPFLNGGLFEEEQEPKAHRKIQFPTSYFEMLFNFFNGYNFTIYENSPEEHTVAVDPEMLGHIFENLIDYNKDTGTFYTPKEIVQYMTQESLIEYLNTHVNRERKDLENLLKNHYTKPFNDVEIEKIDQLLNDVKICDPAIGSGAFPMGMLQEIFNLKAVIAYELKKEWNPSQVKQDIIQNSIYGVDLDEGAVEIARLRFWLSLVVDEGTPKALPNLDYKIMQGNSVVESFKGIDLSKISTGNDLMIVENLQTDLFGDLVDDQTKITISKSGLAEEIQNLIKKYFTAKTEQKKELKDKIQYKITEHIDFNIELRENQLHRQINILEQSYNNLKAKELKVLENYKNDLQNLYETKEELYKIQKREEKPYFLWHLFFADVLSNGGFDIVIGNPPFIEFKNLEQKVKNEIENSNLNFYVTAKGKYDIYITFYELAYRILKRNGILNYITPTRFMNRDYGKSLRKFIVENLKFLEIIDFGDKQNFESAMTYTGIFLLKKEKDNNYLFSLDNDINGSSIFLNSEILLKESWFFNDLKTNNLIEKIRLDTVELHSLLEGIFQGVATGKDEVFIIDDSIIESKKIEQKFLVKFLKGKDISPYKIDWKKNFCIYPYDNNGKVISENDIIEKSPNLYKYLNDCKELLKGRGYFDKSNKLWFELWNQRKIDRFLKPKIMTLDNASRNSFAFDNSGFLGTTTTYSLIPKDSENIKILLAILNSKLLDFYHKKNTIPQAGGFYRYQASFIENLPIKNNFGSYILLKLLSDLIIFIKSEITNKIIDVIDNIHIANFFEEVIDAIVFEIYFPEEMQEKNITVITQIEEILQKHQAGNFENLNDEEKRNRIASIYKELSTGIVQEKMADFILKSPDILKPILQS